LRLTNGNQNDFVDEANPLPVKLKTGTDIIGTVKLSDGTDALLINTDGSITVQDKKYYSEITILASGARTVSGETGEIPVGNVTELVAFIDVTAASGTSPTLDGKFQIKDPVSGKWFDLTDLTFTQATAVTSEMKTKSGLLGSIIKFVYTIGGVSPSFTFSVGAVGKS
jgi:hypothetical protein